MVIFLQLGGSAVANIVRSLLNADSPYTANELRRKEFVWSNVLVQFTAAG